MLGIILKNMRLVLHGGNWHYTIWRPTQMRRVAGDGSFEHREMTDAELEEAKQWQMHR